MSRELENVTRVEDRKFAPPVAVQPPKKKSPKDPDSVRWLSEGSVESAARRLRHFYPKGTHQLAQEILEAAAPHIAQAERYSGESITDESIDAAGEAIYLSETGKENWTELSERMKWVYKEDAKGALLTVILHLNISSN